MLNSLRDKNFWLFFGSGIIVSVAYMDPGNWGTSIGAGSEFGYELLWVIWLSSGMAMLFQYLSGKLGLAGYTIPELIVKRFGKGWVSLGYWALSEIVILATDIAEFLGIVVALNLLFHIPMEIGVLIAILDVVLLFMLGTKNFRHLEYLFFFLVGIISLSYVYEIFITSPDFDSIIYSSTHIAIRDEIMLLVVGIIGATVMPHALFVHSWLTKKKLKKHNFGRKKLLEYHKLENILSLILASLINASILIMSASAFYGLEGVAGIEEAYKTLSPLFGHLASIVFGIALLSAGLSSSLTGLLSGQCVMEPLTDFRVPMWVRRLFTRIINAVPILFAIWFGIKPIYVLIYSQVALSLLIPLPLIPLIYYTSKKEIMGDMVNRKITQVLSWIFAILVVILNVYLVYVGG